MLQAIDTNQQSKVDKSKYVKGIFINVYDQAISEHLFKRKADGDVDLKEIYEAIGCELVERVSLYQYGFFDDSHDLLIDEEGLFKLSPGVMMGKSVILGNCVIFNVDWSKGAWTNATISLKEVSDKIVWLDTQTANNLARNFNNSK
jgi:hypothetical protein